MKKSVSSERDAGPWYKEPWPWIIMAFPATSVVLGFMMLTLALNTNNSLVVDDYYKQGKAINQRIARDRMAAELGVVATLSRENEAIAVQISLPQDAPADDLTAALSAEFLLRWSHVTQDTRDGEARLIPTGQGKYTSVGGSTLPESGRYRLHIEPVGDAWRLVSPIVKLESLGSVEIEPAAFAVPGVTS
jgi:hypothetical protein